MNFAFFFAGIDFTRFVLFLAHPSRPGPWPLKASSYGILSTFPDYLSDDRAFLQIRITGEALLEVSVFATGCGPRFTERKVAQVLEGGRSLVLWVLASGRARRKSAGLALVGWLVGRLG